MASAEPELLIADSSAWFEMLRERESPADLALAQALSNPAVEVLLPEPVQAKVLVGARTDFDLAVDLYRLCRSSGRTVRSLHDCLIVAMAQRVDAPVLHHDHDFVTLIEIAGVAVAPGSLGA